MAENCGGSCSTCKKDCSQKPLKETLLKGSSVKKVIAVVSGKGGVGKSLVTSLLASKINSDGFKTAVLDADITGPSIPTAFGRSKARAEGGTTTDENGEKKDFLNSVRTKNGIQVMSMNFLLEEENTPVIWRGPVISGAVRQFWTDVLWEDVDFMFVDCPPGTGDVPLTVFQSLPVDGIIVVSSPQQLVRVIVEKAVNMANMMNIPILGLIENMSYVQCPDCEKKIKVFGESNIDAIAKEYNLKVLAKLPIEQNVSAAVDKGEVESLKLSYIDDAAEEIKKLLKS